MGTATSGEAGRISGTGIDTYLEAMSQWDLEMRQISPGEFRWSIDYVCVGQMLLYRERWTRRVVTSGATPAGCALLACSRSGRPGIDWCGEQVHAGRFALEPSESEVRAFTPDENEHVSKADRSAAFHRALEFIHGQHGRIGLSELANALGVHPRTLQRAFKEQLGLSLLKYLHWSRMNGAHWDLLASDPTDSSVTEIGLCWGFTELGRFSGEYRRLFGELPQATLLRDDRSASPDLYGWRNGCGSSVLSQHSLPTSIRA